MQTYLDAFEEETKRNCVPEEDGPWNSNYRNPHVITEEDFLYPFFKASLPAKKKYAEEFEAIFHHPLSYYWRWFGFDIWAFSESFSLDVPGKTRSDVVIERFGERGNQLILEMIEMLNEG